MRLTVLSVTVALTALAAAAAYGATKAADRVAAPASAAGKTPAAAASDYAPYVDKTSFAAAYRRLTEAQYRIAIADTFGPAIKINVRFEPERREDGLQAVGNARLSITPSGMEQYYSVARSIADQVFDGKDRDTLVGCAPMSGPACSEQFIKQRGRQLFRRPLTAAEIARFNAMTQASAQAGGDPAKGLKQTLVSLLMAPEFLFRIERAEPDPAQPSGYRLDAYSKAARLSLMLWNTGPDEQLMEAARTGDILTPPGLAKQADRLLASPRVEQGVRAFFADMLEFEGFDTLSKDSATYPKFSQAVADSAREETLKFLVDQLVAKSRDYRDIFTSRDTFVDRTLAYVYDVPFLSNERWAPITFPEDSERAGILTQVTFLSLFAHPAASSPTVRGVKLNEIFLCVEIPQPPPDVDFSKVQALANGTVRARLVDHMTNPGCSGCHRISDPVGLAMERFDGLGQHRQMENGALIDVSAEVGGRKFSGATGLGQYLHDEPRVPACLVRKLHYYGVGRTTDPADSPYLARLSAAFAAKGYRLPALLRGIVTDATFYRVVAPQGAGKRVSTASLDLSRKTPSGDAR